MLIAPLLLAVSGAFTGSKCLVTASRRRSGLVVASSPLTPLEECMLTVGFEMNGISECMKLMQEEGESETPSPSTTKATSEAHTPLALCLSEASTAEQMDECVLASDDDNEPSYG